MTLTRRTLLAATPALLAAGPPGGIAGLERAGGGMLGVFVLDTGTGATLANRADTRFLLASTFKAPLAAFVLSRVDAGRDRLEGVLTFTGKDLLPASPVSEAHAATGRLTVGEACQAVLQRSDNTAANLLLAHVGGPAALTAYVRQLGDGVTSFDRYELIDGRSGTKDTTTPRAMLGLMRTLLLGRALSATSRDRLEQGMEGNVAGRARLRASFPASWRTADRTGTADGVCNDVALLRPPGRPPVLVSVYSEAAGKEMGQQEAVLRQVGALVRGWVEKPGE